MIAFATIFLGLVVGVVPVTVLVEGTAAAVRFELDGKTVGTLLKQPWALPVDFGAQLFPHELVARAIDAAGRSAARGSSSTCRAPRPKSRCYWSVTNPVGRWARASPGRA